MKIVDSIDLPKLFYIINWEASLYHKFEVYPYIKIKNKKRYISFTPTLQFWSLQLIIQKKKKVIYTLLSINFVFFFFKSQSKMVSQTSFFYKKYILKFVFKNEIQTHII